MRIKGTLEGNIFGGTPVFGGGFCAGMAHYRSIRIKGQFDTIHERW